jgi:hypothetical protein
METLKDFLWPIVLVGGLGAFIDFLIGRTGQERAKDFLTDWWVRFDDVRWNNFGREEGLFAANFMEKWLGRRIWSPRRIIGGFILFMILMIFGYSKYLISRNPQYTICFGCGPGGVVFLMSLNLRVILDSRYICFYCAYQDSWFIGLTSLFISITSFSISLSFTRWMTIRMANLCEPGGLRNIIIFAIIESVFSAAARRTSSPERFVQRGAASVR